MAMLASGWIGWIFFPVFSRAALNTFSSSGRIRVNFTVSKYFCLVLLAGYAVIDLVIAISWNVYFTFYKYFCITLCVSQLV